MCSVVLQKVKKFKAEIRKSLLDGDFDLPFYNCVKQFDMNDLIYKNNSKGKIKLNMGSLQMVTRVMQIVEIVQQLLQGEQMITKRNLYYKLVQYYSAYDKIDQDLETLCYNLNLPKEQLCIVSSSRTLILGDITCKFDGSEISSKKQSITNLPVFKKLQYLRCDKYYLLLIEKQSSFFHLYQQYLKKKQGEEIRQGIFSFHDCIMVTSKGYPSESAKEIVDLASQMVGEIYYLGDYDIYGIDIMLSYGLGYNHHPTIMQQIKWIKIEQFIRRYINQAAIAHEYVDWNKEDLKKYYEMINRKYFKESELIKCQTESEILFKQKITNILAQVNEMYSRNKKMELENYFKYLPQNWLNVVIKQRMYI